MGLEKENPEHVRSRTNELYGITVTGKQKKEPTLNDIRKENGLGPISEGDVVLTKV